MSVYAHVASSSCQTFVLPIGDVFVCVRINVLLGKTKVYNVDDVAPFVRLTTDEEVLWFDVSVDELLGVDILHSRYLQRCKVLSVTG